MANNPLQNFVVKYSSGDPIYHEGDVGATMYIVQAGRVRLYREVEGSRSILGDLEKGDFFGEMSILEGLPRNTSAEASEAAELIEINGNTFDKMIRGNIEIAIRMLRKLSIRLREAERCLSESAAAQVAAVAESATRVTPSQTKRGAETASDGLRLVAIDSDLSYEIDQLETLIGRYDPVTEQSPDLDLTEIDLKRSVSRRHARVLKTDSGYALVEEVGALNGTFVNGTQLSTGQPADLKDGDEVGIGMVKMTFHTS